MNSHRYQVEFCETASQIPHDLWDACFLPPAEGLWWYETLEQSGFDDQFTFFYGLISDQGGPVGIAPFFIMDVPIAKVAPQVFLRLLQLIGTIVPPYSASESYLSVLLVSMNAPSVFFLRLTGGKLCFFSKSRSRKRQKRVVPL